MRLFIKFIFLASFFLSTSKLLFSQNIHTIHVVGFIPQNASDKNPPEIDTLFEVLKKILVGNERIKAKGFQFVFPDKSLTNEDAVENYYNNIVPKNNNVAVFVSVWDYVKKDKEIKMKFIYMDSIKVHPVYKKISLIANISWHNYPLTNIEDNLLDILKQINMLKYAKDILKQEDEVNNYCKAHPSAWCGTSPSTCQADFEFKEQTTNKFSFTDKSTANIKIRNWKWDFGDGNTSTEQNPTHDYGNITGYRTVTLTITLEDGHQCNSAPKQVALKQPEKYDPLTIAKRIKEAQGMYNTQDYKGTYDIFSRLITTREADSTISFPYIDSYIHAMYDFLPTIGHTIAEEIGTLSFKKEDETKMKELQACLSSNPPFVPLSWLANHPVCAKKYLDSCPDYLLKALNVKKKNLEKMSDFDIANICTKLNGMSSITLSGDIKDFTALRPFTGLSSFTLKNVTFTDKETITVGLEYIKEHSTSFKIYTDSIDSKAVVTLSDYLKSNKKIQILKSK